jgi:hypothetical protein
MKNYGTPPPASPIPNHRVPTWVSDAINNRKRVFDVIQEQREADKQQDEAAMLERLALGCEVYQPSNIYLKQLFSVEDLLNDIKTITNDYKNNQ